MGSQIVTSRKEAFIGAANFLEVNNKKFLSLAGFHSGPYF
jgi:hypothetical protein